jgi:deazaflavin-dependent oxidoreductase (nitroreductase family)
MGDSDLRSWIAKLRDPDPTIGLKDRLDEIDRDALDNAHGFAAEHTRRYIATDGTDDGWEGPRPILILYTTGRRTGSLRRNPLLYFEHAGVRHVIGSHGGADADPQWYLNLRAEPRVHVRVGSGVYAATARTLAPEERAEMWPALVAAYPMFAEYQAATRRQIPVVALEAAGGRAGQVGLAEVGLDGPIHQDDVGAHVRQQHAGEGPRSDAEQLDQLQTVQWSRDHRF